MKRDSEANDTKKTRGGPSISLSGGNFSSFKSVDNQKKPEDEKNNIIIQHKPLIKIEENLAHAESSKLPMSNPIGQAQQVVESTIPILQNFPSRLSQAYLYRPPPRMPYQPTAMYSSSMPGMGTFSFMPHPFIRPSGPSFLPLIPPYHFPGNPIPPFIPQDAMLNPPHGPSSVIQPENVANIVKAQPADSSLGSLDEPPKAKNLLSGKAYKSRNVYKSIIRHLFSYIRKNREDIIRILRDAGFSMPEIEHGFFKVNYYNDLEREQSIKKNSQATIKKMVSKKTIYTYILRETLNTMLHNWDSGKLGKVSETNSEVYKDVCKYFYEEAVRVTGQSAQGRTFSL